MKFIKKIQSKFYLVFLGLIIVTILCPIPSEAKLSTAEAKAVWSRVAEDTGLTGLPFAVKKEDIPNAWVANGNSVTVTTGMLNILETQAELYGVLSHEAGHAKLNHYENTVNRGVGLSVAATILGQILGGGLAETAAGVGANLAYAGWSREQEVEADDYSVRLAHNNGEDPVGLYSALLKLSKNGTRIQPSGFNSHPPDERRLLHLRNEILSIDPNAKFPDGSEINVSEKPSLVTPPAQTETQTKSTVQKSGGYDIDAAIERMKKEEAMKKIAEGQSN